MYVMNLIYIVDADGKKLLILANKKQQKPPVKIQTKHSILVISDATTPIQEELA